jgi:hypothetical protein
MRSIRPGRAASLVLTLVAALASAGCPELNRQPNRPADPQFSVDDPVGRADMLQPAGASGGMLGRTQLVISEQGGLSDQTRRAQ